MTTSANRPIVPANPEHVKDKYSAAVAADRLARMLLKEAYESEEGELVALRFDKEGLTFLASVLVHLSYWINENN